MRRISVIALAVFLFSAASVVFGQTSNSRVTGTVKDTSDAVVPGVKVVLTDLKTKQERTVQTNDEGVFNFTDVQPGPYSIVAERTGFKKAQVLDLQVNIDKPAVVSVTLEPGEVTQTVSVTASEAQSLIRTEDAKLATTVDVKQVQDLPLNGRNPINIAGGMAGVNTNTNVRQSVINGMRGSFSNITWDGIEINDNLVRTDALFGVNTPSVAGVAEFQVTTQNAGPDEGLGIAQIKFTTPRGGSSYHGEVYDFYRNDKFDANTFFNNVSGLPKPKLLQHQYGFNVGGPFALPRFGEGGPSLTEKKKLFFYFFYEMTDAKQDFTPNRTVLLAGARAGNFTYVRTDNGQLNTVNLLTLSGRSIDPRITHLLSLTPASNNTTVGDTRNTGGFRFNTPNGSTGRNIGFRLDYDINSSNRVEATYSHFLSKVPNDVQLNDIGEQFPGLPGGGQESARPRYAIAWHSSLTSSISNELRFGFSSSTPEFINREDFSEGYRLTLPLITNPIQNFLQQGRAPRNHNLIDNASWVKGNHVIKFGGTARWVRIRTFNDAGIVPQYTVAFNTTTNTTPLVNNTATFPGGLSATQFTSANSLLALLTGAVSTVAETFNVADRTSGFSRGFGNVRHLDYDTLAFYVGDTWRARENLSLNLGIRYEYIGPVTERNGLGLMPKDLSLDVLANPNAVLDFAGKGTGREFLAKDLNNWAPNFSFAWDPFSSGKTSVRGGFSIAYAIDNNATVLSNSSVTGNAGLSSAVTISTLRGTVSGGIQNCPGTPPVCTGFTQVPMPAFQVPRTLVDQLSLTQSPTLFTTEYNLKTPYAIQWNFGVEREFMKDTAFSIGYVGNRGVQLTRGLDTNQVIIFQNGFFTDFLRAQGNLAALRAENVRRAGLGQAALPVSAAFNAAVPGSVALTIFPRLGSAGNLADGTIIGLFDTGQVGELAATYAAARNTYLNTAQPCVPAATGRPCPSFFLPHNGNAFVTDYIGSGGWSSYHGLQAEVRRRLSGGWYYQINYTWSKAFTNSEQSQAEFSPHLDNTIGDPLEKKRLNQDVQHVFKGNFVYELPFGPGKRLGSGTSGFVGKLLGGWQISGIGQWRTGRPITFVSGRGTVNRAARSGNNTPNTSLTLSQLQAGTGVFAAPGTGLPLLFDPSWIASDGRASSTIFTHPAAGTFGGLSLTPVDGPSYWNVDAALIKRTRFGERVGVELRLEAFNVFNHTNFSVGNSQDINSTSFGKINAAFEPRILQWAWKFTF